MLQFCLLSYLNVCTHFSTSEKQFDRCLKARAFFFFFVSSVKGWKSPGCRSTEVWDCCVKTKGGATTGCHSSNRIPPQESMGGGSASGSKKEKENMVFFSKISCRWDFITDACYCQINCFWCFYKLPFKKTEFAFLSVTFYNWLRKVSPYLPAGRCKMINLKCHIQSQTSWVFLEHHLSWRVLWRGSGRDLGGTLTIWLIYSSQLLVILSWVTKSW